MNSPFAIEQAVALGARSERAAGIQVAAAPEPPVTNKHSSTAPITEVRRIIQLFRYALGREPSLHELTDSLEFIDRGEPLQSKKIAHQLAWQFGWGTYDEAARTVQFQALPRIIENTWRGGEKLPDPTLGWALLNAEGGHPGDAAHGVIRRWIAPSDGMLQIDGLLSHGAGQGDGVRGRIVATGAGVIGSYDVVNSEQVTKPLPIEVKAGDTVDFIADSRATVDSDSFNWPITMRLKTPGNEPEQAWESIAGFHGRITPPLTRWQELAQVLLMSNEFAFVD